MSGWVGGTRHEGRRMTDVTLINAGMRIDVIQEWPEGRWEERRGKEAEGSEGAEERGTACFVGYASIDHDSTCFYASISFLIYVNTVRSAGRRMRGVRSKYRTVQHSADSTSEALGGGLHLPRKGKKCRGMTPYVLFFFIPPPVPSIVAWPVVLPAYVTSSSCMANGGKMTNPKRKSSCLAKRRY